MVSLPVDHYQYRKRTINLLSLGTKIASLARQRRRWETLLRSMPRTQSLARDFDPAFDHLTEVTGFGSNPGALRMFEYVPADPQPALVVVLHGCMQKAASYDFGAGWSTLADRHGFMLLLPEQQRANNAKNCFNWFLAGDIERGRGELHRRPEPDCQQQSAKKKGRRRPAAVQPAPARRPARRSSVAQPAGIGARLARAREGSECG